MGVVVKGRSDEVELLPSVVVLVCVVLGVVDVSRRESKSEERRASQVSPVTWPEYVVSKTWKADVVTESQE